MKNEQGCKFRDGLVCQKERCEKCGWNPQVEKERLKMPRVKVWKSVNACTPEGKFLRKERHFVEVIRCQ